MAVFDEQKIIDLLDFAEARGYRVDTRIMTAPAFSVKTPSGLCGICINSEKMHDAETIAHEIGHCETDSFYTALTPCETVGRCEARAEHWAIKKLAPKSEIRRLMKEHRETWEIAEILGVSDRFLAEAMEYYGKV